MSSLNVSPRGFEAKPLDFEENKEAVVYVGVLEDSSQGPAHDHDLTQRFSQLEVEFVQLRGRLDQLRMDYDGNASIWNLEQQTGKVKHAALESRMSKLELAHRSAHRSCAFAVKVIFLTGMVWAGWAGYQCLQRWNPFGSFLSSKTEL